MKSSPSDTHFLSIIVPSYKQAKHIVKNVRILTNALEPIRYQFEIIVVIDGNVDSTFAKLKKAKIPNVRVIQYEENHGKSYAIRVGMHYAKGDYIMFIDAGMEIDPNGMSMLLEHMEWYNADIIVGSKRHPASVVTYSTLRKILSYGYYFLVKLLFHVKVKDTQAGIKIFKKKVTKAVMPRLVEKKFAGDLEILVVAQSLGFNRVYEAPIKLNYNFAQLTSAATLESILGIFIDTLAIFYRKNILGYYEKPHSSFKPPAKVELIEY